MRLKHVGALRELLVYHIAQRHQPAALQQFGGQPGRIGHAGRQHGNRHPDAEHAEPLEQLRTDARVHR
ncbi:Uncharacterised protein [Mycobacterium tuberculosis]|nr:Uncharacterised protein [Mycobacterium tuberculosis]COW61073.1 Uncharacterised protein [Mycobacterium tuberculosis]